MEEERGSDRRKRRDVGQGERKERRHPSTKEESLKINRMYITRTALSGHGRPGAGTALTSRSVLISGRSIDASDLAVTARRTRVTANYRILRDCKKGAKGSPVGRFTILRGFISPLE